MLNPIQIEETYKSFMANLSNLAHDGVVHIDLQTLHDLGLLNGFNNEPEEADDLTQYFHVIESAEKVTLFNEQFLIWIIPKMDEEVPITFVLIALNHPERPHLEIVFSTSGVYNTPRYVLRVLQHFLADTLETEAAINAMEKNGSDGG